MPGSRQWPAKIPRWRSRIKGAWLIKIGDRTVTTLAEAHDAFQQLSCNGITTIPLLFSHPDIRQDISHDGLPIMSSAPFTQHIHDQLNHQWDFLMVVDHLRKVRPYEIVESSNVLNYITRVMRLTRGKLTLQKTGPTGNTRSISSLTSMISKECLGSPFP
jgi:hypothetical protein